MHPMISYAQNCEDVVLMRTFSDLVSGFYVDIGAWHPTNDSVTKAFYDAGWRGVNVEPQPDQLALFLAERPRDTNVGAAVSNTAGSATLSIPKYSALATLNESLLDSSIRDYAGVTKLVVDTVTLPMLLDAHAERRDIHFLKIDVEGHEAAVLYCADFKRHRPLVLVIESTSPHTNAPTWHEWEWHVLGSGYVFALFDGLNRFYLRADATELFPRLSQPANIFDDYVTIREKCLTMRLEAAEAELARLHMHPAEGV